jgi:DsbC/DsbD-like thiol-disulfide interchange protein
MTAIRKWTTAFGSGLCALAIAATAETGAGQFNHSRARLLQGQFADGAWTAGVEIDLAEGWKTYWRMPGEAGIAPEFDWSGSHNVADVVVRWPAPGRYHDASGETIGYAERVVFPITVRPENPSQPIELDLQLSYAACKNICIPVHVELSQVLSETSAISSPAAALIAQFEARVPQRETPGLELKQTRLEETAGEPRLAVALTGEAVDTSTDIFIENFDRAYFRAPRPVGRTGDTTLFHIPIDGLADPDLLRGQTLQLTVVTGTARLIGEVTVE